MKRRTGTGAASAVILTAMLMSAGCDARLPAQGESDAAAESVSHADAPADTETRADASEEQTVTESHDAWKKKLTDQEYYVLREKGTEKPFDNEYWNHKEPGQYVCAGCGQVLFDSETKFDSGSGWPSFFKPVDERKIATEADPSLGRVPLPSKI